MNLRLVQTKDKKTGRKGAKGQRGKLGLTRANLGELKETKICMVKTFLETFSLSSV